ncbi:MAG: GNAT family N-acetyltransferase [Flavobacteriales bacterium]|jgi:ElaA protein|nr:GNAT family N-acetyltransferase [Flavobacteriales bacterium]
MTTDITWQVGTLDDLSPRLVHDLFKLRVDAFVVEQRCAYAELDGRDPACIHIVGFLIPSQLVACCRIVPPEEDGIPHIGRIVIHPDQRGRGLGHQMLHKAIAVTQAHYGATPIALAAQSQLEQFYADHGFTRTGPDYDWDGIPHVDMVLAAHHGIP